MVNDDVDQDWDPETGDTDDDGQPDWNVDGGNGVSDRNPESDPAGGDGFDWRETLDELLPADDGIDGRNGFDWRATLEELLPSDEQSTLERVRRVSNLLDEAFQVPGTNYRIGLDPLIGILPVAGDSVTTVISLYIVGEAARAGVSRSTLAIMLGLVAVDAVAGSIPVLGPIFDAGWKSNKWNAILLERELDAR